MTDEPNGPILILRELISKLEDMRMAAQGSGMAKVEQRLARALREARRELAQRLEGRESGHMT